MSARRKIEPPRFFAEYNGKRYEIRFDRDCTNRCAFVKHGPYGPCENSCSLPDWFRHSMIKFDRAYLVKGVRHDA